MQNQSKAMKNEDAKLMIWRKERMKAGEMVYFVGVVLKAVDGGIGSVEIDELYLLVQLSLTNMIHL